MPVFDRNNVVSYRDLVDYGLDNKLAHGLIREIVSKQAFEDRVRVAGFKVNYVSKDELRQLLMRLLAMDILVK